MAGNERHFPSLLLYPLCDEGKKFREDSELRVKGEEEGRR